MSVIHVLSPLVADMIAAGEVVERPGSVVKELMENSVDAGAKNITVEVRGGGATSIRVTDDGCGMAADDAGNCFLRHATSKLEDERGLEAIKTLGFRGEALAAISAVSRVTLMTRREDDEAGTCVEVAGGEILDARAAGCPKGTDFTVRDLFYNTPARLKFMKADRAEGANCAAVALRVALGRPDVSVRCIRDGKEEFFTAGDGRAAGAVYALLGRELAKSMDELDRWALDRCEALIEKCLAAYERNEFWTVTYAVHNFCVVEMSNFYLDVLKDRLYCEKKDSLERRSGQTAMYLSGASGKISLDCCA